VAAHRLTDQGDGSSDEVLDHRHDIRDVCCAGDIRRKPGAPSMPACVDPQHSVTAQSCSGRREFRATPGKTMHDDDRHAMPGLIDHLTETLLPEARK